MRVQFKTLTGKIFSHDFPEDSTMYDVRKKLSESKNMIFESIQLVMQGKLLKNDEKLDELQLTEKSFILVSGKKMRREKEKKTSTAIHPIQVEEKYKTFVQQSPSNRGLHTNSTPSLNPPPPKEFYSQIQFAKSDYDEVIRKFRNNESDHKGRLMKETIYFDALCNRGICFLVVGRIKDSLNDFEVVLSSKSIWVSSFLQRALGGKCQCIFRRCETIMSSHSCNRKDFNTVIFSLYDIIKFIGNLVMGINIQYFNFSEIIGMLNMCKILYGRAILGINQIDYKWSFQDQGYEIRSNLLFQPILEGLSSMLDVFHFDWFVTSEENIDKEIVQIVERGVNVSQVQTRILVHDHLAAVYKRLARLYHFLERRTDSIRSISSSINHIKKCYKERFGFNDPQPVNFMDFIVRELNTRFKSEKDVEDRWGLKIKPRNDIPVLIFSISDLLKFRGEDYFFLGEEEKGKNDLIQALYIDFIFVKVFLRLKDFRDGYEKIFRKISADSRNDIIQENIEIVKKSVLFEENDVLSGWFISDLDEYFNLRIDSNPLCMVNYVRRLRVRMELHDYIRAFEDLVTIRVLSDLKPEKTRDMINPIQEQYLMFCGEMKNMKLKSGIGKINSFVNLLQENLLKNQFKDNMADNINVEVLKLVERKKLKNLSFPVFAKDRRLDECLEKEENSYIISRMKSLFKEILEKKEFEKNILWRLGEGCFGIAYIMLIQPLGYFVAKIYKDGEQEMMIKRDTLDIPYHRNVGPVVHHTDELAINVSNFPDWEEFWKERNGPELHYVQSSILLMRYYRTSLGEYMAERKRKLTMFEIARILRGILEGVNHLHQHGVVHRDLHLWNIMVDPNYGRVWISDFGCSIDLGGENHRRPDNFLVHKDDNRVKDYYSTALGGDSTFLPPEIVEKKIVDGYYYDYEKCDLFSVGVIAHVLIGGMENQPFQVVEKRLQRDYVPLEGVDTSLAKFVENILKVDTLERMKVETAIEEFRNIQRRYELMEDYWETLIIANNNSDGNNTDVHRFVDSFVTHVRLPEDEKKRDDVVRNVIERKRERESTFRIQTTEEVRSVLQNPRDFFKSRNKKKKRR